MRALFEHLFPALGEQLTSEEIHETALESATRSQAAIVESNADTLGVSVEEYEVLSFADIAHRFRERGIEEPIDPALLPDEEPELRRYGTVR